jgi:hypothetical protein
LNFTDIRNEVIITIYRDGPLEIETEPKIRTFLSATEEEIKEHGFALHYTIVEHSFDDSTSKTPFGFYVVMCRDGDYQTVFGNKADVGTRLTYSTWNKEASLYVYSHIRPRRLKGSNTLGNHKKTKRCFAIVEFRKETGDLLCDLSDVEDATKMTELIKETADKEKAVHNKSVLAVHTAITKKQDGLYHALIYFSIGSPARVLADEIVTIERNIPAKNMKEFLSGLQEAELSYINKRLESLKEEEKSEEIER